MALIGAAAVAAEVAGAQSPITNSLPGPTGGAIVAGTQASWDLWERASQSPGALQLPTEVRKVIADAQLAIKEFRSRQAILISQMREASVAARAQLTSELRTMQQDFEAAQDARAQQIKDRLQQIRAAFVNDRDRAIDQARGNLRKGRGR